VPDAAEAPLEDEFCDCILCFASFTHFHDKEKAMSTLSRILSQDGIFAIVYFISSEGIKNIICHAMSQITTTFQSNPKCRISFSGRP
jgi:ubiquinone/menaquinone biosynthesis C-methylase UbiE